jgi:hypothetical protein
MPFNIVEGMLTDCAGLDRFLGACRGNDPSELRKREGSLSFAHRSTGNRMPRGSKASVVCF